MANRGAPFRLSLSEVNGALGDLGTLLPLMLGSIAVAGLSPTPVLMGFAVFYLATAWVYRLPIPVQPMKAVAAVLLTQGAAPETLAASGVMIGAILILLGATGLIDRLARLVPQSVLAGLQLGLGIGLALVALRLIGTSPLLGLALAGALALLCRRSGLPAALLGIGAAVAAGQVLGLPGIALPHLHGDAATTLPGIDAFARGFTQLALPQLSLTLTNAVFLTALVVGDCYGEAARHVTPRKLALTSGLANLVLAPFGALPMCHGAGGVAAHHRFGARTGAAPLILGLAFLALALLPGDGALRLLAAIPAAGLGALLLVASADLALSRRLFDCRPSCRPVIAVTAAVTVLADPMWGLMAGTAAEALRVWLIRRILKPAS